MSSLLVVEDEIKLLESLARGLREEGYVVHQAATGVAGYAVATTEQIDAIVLDLMLPDGDGMTLLRRLRDGGFSKPILIVTARDTVDDRILGLDAGADDYLVKPFSFGELVARLRALFRRSFRLARDDGELKEQLKRRFFQHAGFDFQVSRADGQPFFCSERLIANPLTVPRFHGESTTLATTQTLPVLGESRVVSRNLTGGPGRFVVQCVFPLASNRKELQALLTLLLTIGPLAIIVALAGGYALARKALAPVEQMRVTAEQITADRLNQRLDVLNPGDGLGRLARTLNRMIDRLHRSVDDMRRFIADAAHELRTPLAVLRTELEVALRSPRFAGDYKRVVDVALEETNRLTRLADQLLTLCRQESGLHQFETEDVQLDALLLDVADKACGAAEQKGMTVEVGSVDSAIVTGDDIQLSQLFFNILDNAIKYTPEGGIIGVRSAVQDHQVSVVIEDTGVGIPPEHLAHVFERFYRVDPSRNAGSGGAGLGLAICKVIAEAHGGQIAVESTVGLGTSFTVSLPVSTTVPEGTFEAVAG